MGGVAPIATIPACPAVKARARSRTEFGFAHQPANPTKQILARRCQPDASTDAVEQQQTQVRLERLDLSRGCRLAQIEACGRAGHSARVGDGHERPQLMQVHR